MFKETGAVEKYGSGIQRIVDECAKHGGIKVDFSLQQHGFKVVVTKIKSISKDVGKDVGKELLSLIEKNPEITIHALAKILNVTSRTVERQLNRLKKENKIAREGGRKEGKWVLL